ncbi:DUF6712 family protein [Mucilaginibacter phyllosphaerae]|uniref:Uncharacterized protein n=1 Tax=Mucilaginibacter phyllosphaerae TaxID=1812349 RepID=A0A4Y8AJN5_9SPHI|nr:hypothetical protein [Mucilaginibacter phyllosphaerae]MBB3967724.1 hypothetical protein [Mucilaginibacter phyllosphaerae]TEW69223.1 hypothetical protein E2R65_03380 [Mucilaginibacter phyllosphaerae]GGH03756.1 hypothetical protein GCM10007352_06550 [Mucilaginibacter phyllosphaerae]
MDNNNSTTPPSGARLATLITPTILQRYEDIAANIKPERIKVFIQKAQELDLKPFLGYILYYDLIKQLDEDGNLKDDASQHYKDLLNGCEYLDEAGHIVLYQGLQPVLAYFTFARFIETDSVHYTATGPVTKRYDNADALPAKDIVKLVQQQRSTANAYANETERFLIDHQDSFPVWHYNHKNKTSRQAGPRIRAVDKTDFNFPADTLSTNHFFITDFLN